MVRGRNGSLTFLKRRTQIPFPFQYSGQLDTVDSVGDDAMLVSFRTRAAAEQVCTFL